MDFVNVLFTQFYTPICSFKFVKGWIQISCGLQLYRALNQHDVTKGKLITILGVFVSADDVNNGKPSPEIYNLAVSRLGLMPKNV